MAPLIKLIDSKLVEIKAEFRSSRIDIFYNSQLVGEYKTEINIAPLIPMENIWMVAFEYWLNGFKKGGKKAFDGWYKLEIQLEKYKITVGPERGKVWGDRAYNELYSLEELRELADRFVELVADDISTRIEAMVI